MDVEYLAFDSFGVKSMCIAAKTGDCNILIDPGIAAEVNSFPLPSRVRSRLHDRYKHRILNAGAHSDTVIVTHYHYDHHICERNRNLYGGKLLLMKDPVRSINASQRARAAELMQTIRGLPKRLKVADGRRFKIGKTTIRFSKPLWHGVEGTNLGYVIMVHIDDGKERLLYSSDVSGPPVKKPTDLIVKENPDMLILDGPPTYLLGYIMAYYNLARSVMNIRRILRETDTEIIVLDHHSARDYRYPDLLCGVYDESRDLRKRVLTVAEMHGHKTKVLEGYEKYGPTRWKKWRKFSKDDNWNVLRNAVEKRTIAKRWLTMFRRYM